MATQSVILLVHGMGSHPKGEIIKEYKKALGDRAISFGMQDTNFIKNVDIKEFNYSEYFDLIRQQFAENAEARSKGFKFLNGKGFEETLLKQLTTFESNFSKDEFFYTHWLDVILYGTMYFGEKVRLDFISAFEKIRKIYSHENIHIVCHSLGTAVVHDALAKYYRTDSNPFDAVPDLKTGNFNIASLWAFANVSRMVNLLNGLSDPNHSTVVTGSDGCANNFINIRHAYDPFTWFKTYDRRMSDKVTYINKVIRNVNTHDFYEYITEPSVSDTLLRFIYGVNISDRNYEEGIELYKKDALGAEVKEMKTLIDAAVSDTSISTIKQAVKKFKAIQNKIDVLKSQI